MSILGSIGSAIGSFGSGLINSALGIGTDWAKNELISKPNAKQAYQRERELYSTRYQMTMADMEKAGLNPILAASSGFQVGSVPSVAQAQYPQGQTYAEGLSAANQVRRTDTEIEVMRQELENKRQVIRESVARIARTRAETQVATQTEKNLVRQWLNLEADLHIKIAEYERTSAQAGLYGRQREEVNKQIEAIGFDIEKTKMVIEQLKKVTAAYNGPIGGILGYIEAITKALGLHTSLGAGATSSAVRMVK